MASLGRPYDIAVTNGVPIATPLQQCARIVVRLTMPLYRHPLSLHASVPFFVAVFVWAQPVIAQADVYYFVADDGVSHFSDSPNDPRYQLLLQLKPDESSASSNASAPDLAGKAFANDIAEAARSNQVEAALLHAVIAVESNYNPRAVSRKGALGLMQLMPGTARSLGVVDPMNASQNIRGGAKYLRQLLDQFSNNKSLALAAYNAGPAAVLSHGGKIPPIAETRSYVPAVLQRYAKNILQFTSNNAE